MCGDAAPHSHQANLQPFGGVVLGGHGQLHFRAEGQDAPVLNGFVAVAPRRVQGAATPLSDRPL